MEFVSWRTLNGRGTFRPFFYADSAVRESQHQMKENGACILVSFCSNIIILYNKIKCQSQLSAETGLYTTWLLKRFRALVNIWLNATWMECLMHLKERPWPHDKSLIQQKRRLWPTAAKTRWKSHMQKPHTKKSNKAQFVNNTLYNEKYDSHSIHLGVIRVKYPKWKKILLILGYRRHNIRII